jgi:hypothetical protein
MALTQLFLSSQDNPGDKQGAQHDSDLDKQVDASQPQLTVASLGHTGEADEQWGVREEGYLLAFSDVGYPALNILSACSSPATKSETNLTTLGCTTLNLTLQVPLRSSTSLDG